MKSVSPVLPSAVSPFSLALLVFVVDLSEETYMEWEDEEVNGIQFLQGSS